MKAARITFVVIFLLLGLLSIHTVLRSGFFQKNQRVNILFYSDQPVLYSVGKGDGIDYILRFSADTKAPVAGGYGEYRIGAIGKLAQLEKNPAILQRTFSSLSSSFVHYYFYQPLGPIYFGKTEKNIEAPSARAILSWSSNASFIDRIFLLFLFMRNPHTDFRNLSFTTIDTFNEKYLGYLYDRTYRDEKLTVQLLYDNNAATAHYLGQMLEGEGIRVADITQEASKSTCSVVIKSTSQTARALSEFFKCPVISADTGPYDILFHIGSLEHDWEVNQP